MLIGVISDIHGNYEALEAVFEALDKEKVSHILCAGDIVGYGANPNECVEAVSEISSFSVTGNHDLAVLDKSSSSFFNRAAREACDWTRSVLSPSSLSFLQNIKLKEELKEFGIFLVHSDLWLPKLFDYIQSAYDAVLNLRYLSEGSVCFVGHSHVPIGFYSNSFLHYSENKSFKIPDNSKAIINVGSVGQPRDGNPRSSFVLYETTTKELTFRRISYDYEKAAKKIRKVGLPHVLGDRLKYGR